MPNFSPKCVQTPYTCCSTKYFNFTIENYFYREDGLNNSKSIKIHAFFKIFNVTFSVNITVIFMELLEKHKKIMSKYH